MELKRITQLRMMLQVAQVCLLHLAQDNASEALLLDHQNHHEVLGATSFGDSLIIKTVHL